MTSKQNKIYFALIIILFLSGTFSLIYQIAWVRFLTLLLGSTTLGITTVVSSFMGGLALGSWLASKYLTNRKNPLKIYAFLELITAIFAFLSPLLFNWLFSSLPVIMQKIGDANLSIFILRIVFSAVIMLIPTICQGAVLPVLAKYLQQFSKLAERRITIIYGFNTVGACAGCLTAGYFLLPNIGLINTIYITAAANALITVVILLLPRLSDEKSSESKPQKKEKKQNGPEDQYLLGSGLSSGAKNFILLITTLVGFTGLVSELVWTRLIVLTVGGSIYAYSTILAVYLCFYGIGAAFGGYSLKSIASKSGSRTFEVSRTIFYILILLMSLATTLSIAFANILPDYYIRNFSIESSSNMLGLFGSQLVPAIMLVGLATFISGVFFSYGLFMMKQCTDDPSHNTSHFYAWNTVGGIAGSIIAAFLLIPVFGLDHTLRLTSTLLIIIGLVSAFFTKAKYNTFLQTSGIISIAMIWFLIPPLDRSAITSGAGINTPRIQQNPDVIKYGVGKIYDNEVDMISYKDGFTATITVTRNKFTNELALKTNGKGDGSSFTDMPTQKLCGYFPALFHSDPKNTCVIGFGTGTTVGSLAMLPEIQIDAVEIEPAIIDAAMILNDFNNKPLDRKNVNLLITDGRLHLQRSSGKYDMITSEPSNPWLSGVSDLFTLEYYKLAHKALTPDGVFGQWIQMYHLKPDALKLVFRSFREVFPEAYLVVLNPGIDIMLIGCKGPYRPSLDDIKDRISQPEVAADIAADPVNITTAYELFSRVIFGPDQIRDFAGEGPINTDIYPILSYIAPLSLFDQQASSLNAQNITKHWDSNINILKWDLSEDETKLAIETQENYLATSFLNKSIRQ
ncbi:MAG TPA: fused MFS/spermidine synthase [Clostridiales bacterium]|nr:fused MFS/spermidine synthase [Clostridiales bacterium]HQP70035.1 fused MFS/spermidine synthase [Clostridiales bacterium]